MDVMATDIQLHKRTPELERLIGSMSLDRGKGVSETASTAFDRNLVEWLPRFTKIKLRCDGGMAKDSV